MTPKDITKIQNDIIMYKDINKSHKRQIKINNKKIKQLKDLIQSE
jgi:hypothetical protein